MINYHKSTVVFGLAALSCACLMTGCKKKPEKIDLGSTHTTAAETMAAETTAAETEAETTTQAPSMDAAVENAANSNGSSSTGNGQSALSSQKNLSTKLNTYTSGKVSIQYPSVTNLDDAQKAAALDTLLKDNALSVIKAYKLNEANDTLNITCKVLSADRNRITAVYTGTLSPAGAAHPTNLYFSNTINVGKGTNLGFSHFADPYTMAGYVLSGDCVFPKADASQKTALMEYKNTQTLEYYTNLFNHADFPVDGNFPESFSYEYGGDIYFTIPVPHALGDYALIRYTPDTK